MKTRLAGILVLALALWGGEAEAQQADFTIQVPVELNRIDAEVTAFKVSCYVLAGGSSGSILAKNGGIGSAADRFESDSTPLEADGSYSGSVTVSMDFPGVTDSEKNAATGMMCDLVFVANNQEQSLLVPNPPPWAAPADGSQFTARVRTDITTGN